MSQELTPGSTTATTRRDFLKTTSVLAAGAAVAGSLSLSRSAHAAGGDVLKIGLIGCGGRGTGAAANALSADTNCKLVAMADAFGDRLNSSLEGLKKQFEEKPEKIGVDADHCFVGFDAADKLIASDVDVVLLCQPPHFRPMHLKAAIDAGKHVFCEKPVAVDAPGIRSVLASAEEAKKKNLNLVAGLCWRYHPAVRETMSKILDGAIGEIKSIQETYLTGPLGTRPRQPDWSEMTYQLRNWQYFVWLSGDFNTEQHVHSLDKAAWAMHDEPPVAAWGLGGSQLRNLKIGDVYDHHAVVYEFKNGMRVHAYCRQIPGCYNDTSDVMIGTKGEAIVTPKHSIKGETNWHYTGPDGNMYDIEHQELFAAIRSGKTINNGDYVAKSSMWAILGRMANYTGQKITWEDAMKSEANWNLPSYSFEATPPTQPDANGNYPVALPGVTKIG
jgi:predicted dehydrogenase